MRDCAASVNPDNAKRAPRLPRDAKNGLHPTQSGSIERTVDPSRRGAGVVERGGLENRCPFTGTQGSNPCLSATTSHLVHVNTQLYAL